jgi:hypothetical protein
MVINPLTLLQQLAGLAAPIAPALTGGAGGDGGFSAALDRARAGDAGGVGPGGLASSLPVKFDEDVAGGLSDEQLRRLSLAADRAQAAGLGTALMLIDGQALVMDVATRTIIQRVEPGATLVGGIDGLVPVPPGTLGSALVGADEGGAATWQSSKRLLARLGGAGGAGGRGGDGGSRSGW